MHCFRRRAALMLGFFVLASFGAVTANAMESAWALSRTVAGVDPAQRYALVIGISKYPKEFKSLPGPATDAKKFRDLLVNVYGYRPQNVVMVRDSFATRDTIIRLIREHLGKAGQHGTALFYYAGHGVSLPKNYSIPDKEGKHVDQALQVWSRTGRSSVVLDDELGFLLDGLRARRTLAVIDSCFSGTMTKLVSMQMKLRFASVRRRRVVTMSVDFVEMQHYDFPKSFVSDNQPVAIRRHLSLTASREDEEAVSVPDWPWKGESRSVFSYHLETALRTQPPAPSMRDLYNRVAVRVMGDNICKIEKYCQHPQLGGPGSAEPISFYLGVP